jgi:hypothetical protein
VRIDVFDGVFDRFDRAGVIVRDIQAELFAKPIDEKKLVHRICFEIFDKPGFHRNILTVYLQYVGYYALYIIERTSHGLPPQDISHLA